MLQNARNKRDLAMFNLAIDSKLRGYDVIAIKVDDVAPNGYAVDRATVRQRKTGRPVRFELTEHTRHAIDAYLRSSLKKPGEFLFTSPRSGRSMTPRQYGRLVSDWLIGIGLDPHLYGTHSLRRTKATLIYRRTGNLRHTTYSSEPTAAGKTTTAPMAISRSNSGVLPFALRVHQDGPAPRATGRWTPEGSLRTTDRVPGSKKSHRRPIMQSPARQRLRSHFSVQRGQSWQK